ncbi:ComEA family DNA-binding protein [Metabacillus sp. 84]|uniref:ComEA family DNA-binding protein n=1 Tax=unclassified Metabacillus TaxID=2675274 RepID=UPI003CF47ED1
MSRTITSKGRGWELLHSIWMLWTFFPMGFTSFISFLYIAFRVKQKKWTIMGFLYAVPVTITIIAIDVAKDQPISTFMIIILFPIWIMSIFHAFKVRTEYLLRLEARKALAPQERERLRNSINKEYQPVSPASPSIEERPAAAEPAASIDVNTASEQELASIPGIGVILAKKAVTVRNQSGAFDSADHFGEQLGLKPHVLERIRPYIKVSSASTDSAPSQDGRVIDY